MPPLANHVTLDDDGGSGNNLIINLQVSVSISDYALLFKGKCPLLSQTRVSLWKVFAQLVSA